MLYNFCFVTPLFSLASYDRSYLVTFGIMFATAMVAGELTARIADNARTSAENAFKTRVLLETNQLLQQAHSAEECARVAMNQLIKLLKLDVVFYTAEHGTLGKTLYESAGTENRSASLLTDYERAVATWTYTNNKRAGAGTRTLPRHAVSTSRFAPATRYSVSSASTWRGASSKPSSIRSSCLS